MDDRADLVKAIVSLVVFVALLGGGGYWVRSIMDKQAKDREALEAVEAVTTLPDGVEQNWLAYVDQQMGKLIQRRGAQLYLKEPDSDVAGGAGTFVSITMPYSIDCSDQGTIKFGTGEDPVEVRVFGMWGDPDRNDPKNSDDDAEPRLGVSFVSKASDTLRQTLCTRIADDMQVLTKP